MQKCAGCHSIGGGALTGPDLKAAQQWPETNLIPAIQRMEKNVGPLKPEDVKSLAGLILAPEAASRLAEERKRVTLSQAAKLAPASATTGEALFFGRQPLANGGLACSACHAVNGRGGNLAIDLTPSFTKLGAIPLGSTIENVTFPLMQVAYLKGPITQQETVHLVKYLESVSTSPATPQGLPPVHVLGTMGAVAVVGAMGFLYKDRNRGVRAALVRDAIRRNR
jgi:mono/diheme cytochrome c family protein